MKLKLNKYSIRVISILLVSIMVKVYAQTNLTVKKDHTLSAIAKLYPNKISLRWNISSFSKMNYLAETGVIIDRLIIDNNNATEKNWTTITQFPIKAYTKAELEKQDYKKDTGLAAVYRCLYLPTKFPNVNELENIQNQQMDAENRYVLLSIFASQKSKTAIAAGLGYDDLLQVDSNKSYVYRISIADKNKTIGTAFVYLYGKSMNEKIKIETLKAIGNDKSISLKWNDKNLMLNGYWIEKSTNAKDFERINKVLYIPTIDTFSFTNFYADSVANYKKYCYRIVGLNSFGEYIYSNVTPFTFASDLTPTDIPNLKAEIIKDKVVLNWTIPADDDLLGFYILYGKKTDKTDSVLVKKFFKAKVSNYEFSIPNNFKSSYYRIMAIDTAGNSCYSNSSYVFISDQIPPKIPWNLKGNVDSNGVVSINWAIDSLDDIMGYKVFFANQENHTFTAISNIIPTNQIMDTINLNTLTKYIYYKVVAVDQNYNHSDMSKALKINRPDIIPPPEPVILNYIVKENTVKFNWTNVEADDFKTYHVLRRKAGETKWIKIKSTTETEILDSNLFESMEYEYALKAIDSSNISSNISFPIAVKTGKISKVENIKLKMIEKQVGELKVTFLTWSLSKFNVKRTLIYNQVNGNLINNTSVESNVNEYKVANKNVEIAIRFLFTDGTQSELYILSN